MENQQQPEPVLPVPDKMNENPTPKSGIPVKTLLLIIVLAIVAFGLVTFALVINRNNPSEQTQITPSPSEEPQTLSDPVQTTLIISSSPVKLSTPSAYSTDIVINTGQDAVNKVQLEIAYDPKILTKVDIDAGPFFTDPQVFLKNIDSGNGRISFALGVQEGENGVLGQGVLAKLSFTAIQKSATASVTLLPKTQVTADGYSESVLKSTIDGLFNLNTAPKATATGR